MDCGDRGDAWEADYRTKGDLYGGAPRSIPEFPLGTLVLELGCGSGNPYGGCDFGESGTPEKFPDSKNYFGPLFDARPY